MRRWTISVRLLAGNLASELRDFLTDHSVPVEERQACGMVEMLVRCSERDALCLPDALQLLGTRALFDEDGSCLLIVRPEGDSA